MGFATIDVSDPRKPEPVGFTEISRGSHSAAAHPTKPLVYNGDGFPEVPGEMQIWSIKDPSRPKLVTTVNTGEHSPHDLAFNADGSTLATANVSSLKLYDTTDPQQPALEFVTQCPGCQHTHETRFTPDGKRLVANDESVNPFSPCPGGALYFYDVLDSPQGHALSLTGTYTPSDVGFTSTSRVGFCTAHVFDISADGTKVAASWHYAGLRYVDISKTNGATWGSHASPPDGAKELGWWVHPEGDTFSAKFHRGPYIYTMDSERGFEIFRIGD
jgi:hypothetical protein